jgi:hypothetical protein
MRQAHANSQVSFDQLAVQVLLSKGSQAQKQRLLKELSAQVTAAVHKTHACPDCGSTAPKEDNGIPPSDFDYSLLCLDCGESWSPNVV